MPKYIEKSINEFRARSHDGQEFLVVGKALYRPENDESPISMELKTSDGRSVLRIEKGVYQITESGVLIRSHDADAP